MVYVALLKCELYLMQMMGALRNWGDMILAVAV